MKQRPLFDQWCRTAVRYVPRLRRSAVYAELYAHLEDHRQALVQEGRDDEAAMRIALAAMGDADETGRQLRRSEWTPRGIARLLQLTIVGGRWVPYYRGTDERRYTRLRQELTAARIEFRTEELDPMSRTIGSMNTPGRHPLDNTPRRDGTNPAMMASVQFSMWSQSSTVYTLYLRRRDLPLVQRLERS